MPDVRLLRSSLEAFAVEVGRPLRPWQARALALEARFTAVRSPRQCGKSRSLAVLALWRAFREPGHRVLVLSAGEDASRRLLAEVRAVAHGSPLLASSVVDDQAALLTLANGSEIRSVPASERQVRGWTVSTLLVDEAALVGEDLLLGAAIPTTAARPDARIVLASSPLTTAGAFYDFVVRGEAGSEHVRSYRWRLEDADWITPSTVAAARESMSELRFRAEYEGEWASGGDLLFPRPVLERVMADYAPASLDALAGPCAVYAGMDWGWTSDRSALVAVARLAGEPRFGVVTAHAWPAGTTGPEVVADVTGSPAVFDTLTSEVNGLGAPLTLALFEGLKARAAGLGGGARRSGRVLIDAAELDAHVARRTAARRARSASGIPAPTRKLALTTSSASKSAGYSALRLLVDRGELVIPRAARDLVAELLTLRVDLTPSGNERIEAAGSAHDDLTDALVAALSPVRDRAGRWHTLLGELAAMSDRLPAPRLPEGLELDRLERTVTAGGLEVPRTPVWQSPRGAAVTAPARLALAPEPTDPRLADLRAGVARALTTTTAGGSDADR
jgi:hypothetical protein